MWRAGFGCFLGGAGSDTPFPTRWKHGLILPRENSRQHSAADFTIIFVMTESELRDIYEIVLEQHKAIRNLKVELESLKKMMFDHRPEFMPTFDENVKLISQTAHVKSVDEMISRLEEALKED